MPGPCCCCCESSLSFAAASERGESLSPDLALQPTRMPHVLCARASQGKELLDALQWVKGRTGDRRAEQDTWEGELPSGLWSSP